MTLILILNLIFAGPVAQWITRLTTGQEIPGSTPGRFVLLRMRQSGVENNKSEVRGDFPSN